MAASVSRFRGQVDLPVSADKAFAWHEREGALDRLLPPWVKVEIRGRGNGVCDGSTVELRQRLGPLAFRWVAEHEAYVKGRQFCDIQRRGPFAYWAHT
ncbi:MAG: TIGR01777 family protein, partial [Pirellulales bacterium]|nr:TIGR01777 family protein [Pirellulales bacterium]